MEAHRGRFGGKTAKVGHCVSGVMPMKAGRIVTFAWRHFHIDHDAARELSS
jgi:hypothetical protein